MDKQHKFSARVFLGAGIYGVVVLLPQYFLEEKLARDFPPPLTHPEHFYGFIGVALAWQFVLLIIARDVQRYRLLMLPAILEKLSFGVAVLVLYAQGRVAPFVAGAGMIDLVLAVLFVLAFRASRRVDISQRNPTFAMIRDVPATRSVERTAAPPGSRTVQEIFNATIAAGARPRRRSLSLD